MALASFYRHYIVEQCRFATVGASHTSIKPVKNDALGQHGYSNGTVPRDCSAGIQGELSATNKWPAVNAKTTRAIISFSTCDVYSLMIGTV
jgi:hypothetical protein